jgi:FixJ family two-component response regulator
MPAPTNVKRLNARLDKLTHRQCQVALMRWGRDMTLREVGSSLRIHWTTVHRHEAAVMRHYESLRRVRYGRRRMLSLAQI